MNPASMVAQALDEFDTNKDGKLQKDEVAAITDERRRGRMAEADTNHDGDIDRNELTVAMTKVVQMIRARMEAGGGGGPPGGGPGS